MSVLHADELSAAISSPIFDDLKQDATEAKELGEILTQFKGYGYQKLKGLGWDKVNDHLEKFNESLQERAKLADSFGEKIKNVLTKCLNFLGEDPAVESLNTESLDSLIEARDDAQASYNYIYSHKDDKKIDSKTGKEVPKWNNIGGKLAELQGNIDLANKLIDKIGRMESLYSESLSELGEAYSEVLTYGKSVDDLEISGKWKFDPKAPFNASDGYGFDVGIDEEGTIERPIEKTEENGVVIREGDKVIRRANGTVESITSPDGTVTYYNNQGNETRKEYDNGDYIEYNEDKTISKQSINGIVTENEYYEDGSIKRQLINGHETYYEQGAYKKNESGEYERKIISVEPNGVEIREGDDIYRGPNNEVVGIKSPDGTVTYYGDKGNEIRKEYDNGDYREFYEDGSIKSEQINGNITQYDQGTYSKDETGEYVREVISDDNGIIVRAGDEVTYREDGSIVAVTRPDQSSVEYDKNGLITEVTDSDGTITGYFTGEDVVSYERKPNGDYTAYYHDGSISETGINGNVKKYEPGELIIAEDGTRTKTDMTTGSKTVTYPDGEYRVYRSDNTLEVMYLDGKTSFYDENGKMTSIQNSNGDYVSFYDDGSIKEIYYEGPNPSSKTYEKGECISRYPDWIIYN